MAWHVVATEHRAEAMAQQSLLSIGLPVVLPMRSEWRAMPKGGRAETLRPFWPGYIIAGWSAGFAWGGVCGARGVAEVLRHPGQPMRPATVPARVVDAILSRMSLRGVVDDATTAADLTGPANAMPDLMRGASAVLADPDSPLHGHEGVVQWSDARRVELLFHILGAERRVSVSRDRVRAA